jgi:hypothetical protein
VTEAPAVVACARLEEYDVTQRGIAATKHAALCSPAFSGDTDALAIFCQENNFSALVSRMEIRHD